MVAVDQNGGTRTFNSCSAKYARFLKLLSAEAGRHRARVSSSLEGVPRVAVEKVYDGDPSKYAWYHIRSGQTFSASKDKGEATSVPQVVEQFSDASMTSSHGRILQRNEDLVLDALLAHADASEDSRQYPREYRTLEQILDVAHQQAHATSCRACFLICPRA